MRGVLLRTPHSTALLRTPPLPNRSAFKTREKSREKVIAPLDFKDISPFLRNASLSRKSSARVCHDLKPPSQAAGDKEREAADYGNTINVVREKILSFRYQKLEDYELEEKVEN